MLPRVARQRPRLPLKAVSTWLSLAPAEAVRNFTLSFTLWLAIELVLCVGSRLVLANVIYPQARRRPPSRTRHMHQR